jgi:putative holliday junction resolvase
VRILAIDYGERRIGLALSDPLGYTAQPLETLEGFSQKKVIEKINLIIADKTVTKIIIGNPINMDGTESRLSREVLTFAEALKKNITVEIELYDERLSSAQAERMLIDEADISREKRKKVIDKIAAAIILQSYLDHKSSEEK